MAHRVSYNQQEGSDNTVDRFLSGLLPSQPILLLPHDNPDPDALASALALSLLIQHKLNKSAQIGLGGIIGRSENRALVSTLDIPLVPVADVFPDFRGQVVLVDTQPGRANNSLPDHLTPQAVIDHHPDWGNNGAVPFVDLREHYGATSTVVTEYLEAAEVPFEPRVATALFYGIASETQHLGRETELADIRASQVLYPYVNKRLLSSIENPPLPPEYFSLLSQAIDNAVLYSDVVVSMVDSTFYPDVVAEFADFLLRLDSARWAVCLAPYQGFIHVSIRTNDPNATAGLLLASLLPSGMAGGHGMVAGGKLKVSSREWKDAATQIVQDFLTAVGRAQARSQPLVGQRGETGKSAEIRSRLLALSPQRENH